MGEAAEDEIDRAIGGDWGNDYDAEQDEEDWRMEDIRWGGDGED
jgi:hypothetical protein